MMQICYEAGRTIPEHYRRKIASFLHLHSLYGSMNLEQFFAVKHILLVMALL